MYQEYWGLREKPFSNQLDPRSYHPSATHEEALARLHYLVAERRRLGLLTGPSGSGKSLLLVTFGRQLERKGTPVARLSLQGVEPAEFLWQVAAGWGLSPARCASRFELWRSLTDRFAEYRWQNLSAVILLDHADEAAEPVLEQVERLCRFDASASGSLTVVLAARRGAARRLGLHLLELAELDVELEPWELADTEAYISQAMLRAGRKRGCFTAPAVARLNELAEGSVRRVQLLADLALLAAAAQRLPQVGPDTVEAVHEELGVMDALAW